MRRSPVYRTYSALLTLFLLISYWPAAHASINYYAERKVWVLQAGETTYAMGVNERGELQSIYWGSRVTREADFSPAHSRPEVASFDISTTTTPQEYPGWGAELYNEPALKATYADGNRDVVLHFVEQHIDGDTLEIELKDMPQRSRSISITASIQRPASSRDGRASKIKPIRPSPWRARSRPPGRCRKVRATAGTTSPATGARSGSCILSLCRPGAHVIESRRGSTSHQANPWFAIDRAAANNRGEWAGVVWRAGLERQLAHHGGADRHAAGTRHRRLQSL